MEMETEKSWVAIIILDQIDFKTKAFIKDSKRTLYNNKGVDTKRGYNLVNMYVRQIGAPKCVKQILTNIKGETDNHTVIAEEFSTH